MFGWTSSTTPREPGPQRPAQPAPPAIVHDDVQVRVLGLLVTDTFRWKRDWAAWRIRFAYDNDHRGLTVHDVNAFVREMAASLCQGRWDCTDIVLYLAEGEDLKSVFRAYGAVPQGMGLISGIQSREAYLHAAQLAAELAALSREPDRAAEDDALALPDLAWDVKGYGLSRVATATLRGRRITVRLGFTGGQELWMVDVNDRRGCARFRARADAMSKMGVAAALKAYERLRQA